MAKNPSNLQEPEVMPACRFCGTSLQNRMVDLGMSPLCQKHVAPQHLNRMEPFYPLKVWVCTECWLVQLEEYVSPTELFEDYEYFSSYSDSWVEHARKYVVMIKERLGLDESSLVAEIASNDGYLLQHFVDAGVPVVGIEPAANVADVARQRGINTVSRFFGADAAKEIFAEIGKADLIVGNNVLAHVPDINDFVAGLGVALKPEGVVTMEFPHLCRLIEGNQFDTIYHEHFSYLSLSSVVRIFAAHELQVFDVEEIPTHGGSIRIYGAKASAGQTESQELLKLLAREQHDGYMDLAVYTAFDEKVKATKRALLTFLIGAKNDRKTIVGYGAPGKGNTLLNYCGIGTDFLDYTVDRSPHKQGNYPPGTHIPIIEPEAIARTRPDFVLILPWNLKEEISNNLSFIDEWGGKLVVPIPTVEIL
jgi:SAM-dependent methyltransferase